MESRWGRYFPHLSRPALGPKQPPVQWVLDFHGGGVKERPGLDLDPSPPSSAVVKKMSSYTSINPMGCTACTEPQCLYRVHFSLPFYYCTDLPCVFININHNLLCKFYSVFRSSKCSYSAKGFCDSEVHSDVTLWCVVRLLTAWTVQCAVVQNSVLYCVTTEVYF